MQDYALPNDNGPAVEFTGEELARVGTQRNNSYRWTEMIVYRSRGGKIILHQIGHTTFENERTLYSTEVFNDFDGLVRYLKFTTLARNLYKKLGLDTLRVE